MSEDGNSKLDQYDVWYWSNCGSLEFDLFECRAQSRNGAEKKFLRFIKKAGSSDLTVHYNIYDKQPTETTVI